MNDRMGELFTVSYYKRASLGSNEITRHQVPKTQQKEVFFPTWAPSTLQNSLPKDTADKRGLPKLNYHKKREKMQTADHFNSKRIDLWLWIQKKNQGKQPFVLIHFMLLPGHLLLTTPEGRSWTKYISDLTKKRCSYVHGILLMSHKLLPQKQNQK